MVGAIALKTTDRVGGTAREAAVGDLRAEASAPYLTDGEHEVLKAYDDNAADIVRTMKYMGALENSPLRACANRRVACVSTGSTQAV